MRRDPRRSPAFRETPSGAALNGLLSAYPVPDSGAPLEIDVRGVSGAATWNSTGNNVIGYTAGGFFQAGYAGSGILGNLSGNTSQAVVLPGATGTISNAYGGNFQIINEGSTGTITAAAAGNFGGTNTTNNKIINWYGGYFANPGNSGAIGNIYGIYLENQTGASAISGYSGTGRNYAIYSAGGTSYFAGPIGLGVLSPTCAGATATCKLAVAGAISAQEVLVTTTGADYVFDPAYRLKPLTEVSDYIKTNHHLPEIPSAADMSQNGVSLGDLQSKLLAKIEELTVHMIEAEKENQKLRDRVAKLEAATPR
jgi:hypothetical protein